MTRTRVTLVALLTLACHGGPSSSSLQQMSDTSRTAWALFGISHDAVSGVLVILEDHGDYLRIRIGQEELSVGDTNVVVPKDEFARIRQLRRRQVVAGTWTSTQKGSQGKYITVGDHTVCIGEGAEWEVPAAELRRLNSYASWRTAALEMEKGDWAAGVERFWRRDNTDRMSSEVSAMLTTEDPIGFARDVTGWYTRVAEDKLDDIPPIEIRLNRRHPRVQVASVRGLAIDVIGAALGIYYMRWNPEMSDLAIARRLWTTVMMLQHIDLPYECK